jgi:hypothetical protein
MQQILFKDGETSYNMMGYTPAQKHDWRIANRERLLFKDRQRYSSNKEQMNALMREWYKTHRETVLARYHERWDRLAFAFGGECQACGVDDLRLLKWCHMKPTPILEKRRKRGQGFRDIEEHQIVTGCCVRTVTFWSRADTTLGRGRLKPNKEAHDRVSRSVRTTKGERRWERR